MSAGVEAPLVRQFDLLATAPGGVARLRELILTLAVQGKLVPQEAGDEPASVLLQRIRAEKDRLIAAGKIKRDKEIFSIREDEKPFELQPGWAWVRFGEASINRDGERIPVSSSDRESRGKIYDYYGASGVIDKIDDYLFDKTLLLIGEDGANLINRSTPIAFLAHGKYWVNNHAHVIDTTHPGLMDYLALFINAISLEPYVTGTAQPKMNQAKLNSIVVALPPLAEQSRIVTRVEELMRLCDALEQQRQLETAQHAQLLNTLLGALTDCTSPDELAANWQRVSDHFDLLLDRPEAVDALEQTILQLAVRGLLVPQDPADEPASVLLQRIRAEKDRWIAEGKIKRDKPLPAITDKENLFDLPQGWESVIVANVFDVTSGSTFDAGLEKQSGTYMYVKVGDMNLLGNETEITTSSRFIDPDERMTKALIPSGSIIFPKRGGAIATNKKRLVKEPIFVDLNTMAITPILALTSYAFLWLTTIDLASLNTGTSVPQINHKDIDPLPFPLPPLAEQTRIVARVTQLRDLCTTLRQRLAARQTTQRHLAEALVEV